MHLFVDVDLCGVGGELASLPLSPTYLHRRTNSSSISLSCADRSHLQTSFALVLSFHPSAYSSDSDPNEHQGRWEV